jgi:hypothetical protein
LVEDEAAWYAPGREASNDGAAGPGPGFVESRRRFTFPVRPARQSGALPARISLKDRGGASAPRARHDSCKECREIRPIEHRRCPLRSKSILASAAVAAALIAAAGATAASPDGDHRRGDRRLKADLRGFNEVLTVSTPARGSFHAVLSNDEAEIKYSLQYTALQGTVTQAHIHFGDHHMNGGISVWLCGTAALPGPTGTPTCGVPGDGPEATGTLTAAQVVGPAGQGIAAGEFAELVRAIKSGVTYVNVHSTVFPGGEIRGEIRVD